MELTVYFTSNGVNRYRVHDNVRIGRKIYPNVTEAWLLANGFRHVVREYVSQEVYEQSVNGWQDYQNIGRCWAEFSYKK